MRSIPIASRSCSRTSPPAGPCSSSTFLLTWLALRGTAPGSSVLPAFFSGWFATIVAAPAASVVGVVIRSIDQQGIPFGPAISSSLYATTSGLKWGWVAALVATVVWMIVRPRPGAPSPTGPVPPPATTAQTSTGLATGVAAGLRRTGAGSPACDRPHHDHRPPAPQLNLSHGCRAHASPARTSDTLPGEFD